jgi:hypothetical protein
MGKANKRSQEELRAEARGRLQELPAETATGRLEGGNERWPEPERLRRLDRPTESKRE